MNDGCPHPAVLIQRLAPEWRNAFMAIANITELIAERKNATLQMLRAGSEANYRYFSVLAMRQASATSAGAGAEARAAKLVAERRASGQRPVDKFAMYSKVLFAQQRAHFRSRGKVFFQGGINVSVDGHDIDSR